MIYTISTRVDVDTIEKEIEEKAKEVSFNLFNAYKINRVMEEKGCAIVKEINIFEFCHPHGVELALSELPSISVYLPTKISFYEVDGFAELSTIGVASFMDDHEVDERFKAYMTILFENVKRVMHSWD
ncbi:DUF302 domain-containing protein [Sulfurovum sp.]|uniref:DUF302 domain-containing protein n=1 Tax=Sulfurovum sp. TaxID=1969726 RepID=UPI003567D91D